MEIERKLKLLSMVLSLSARVATIENNVVYEKEKYLCSDPTQFYYAVFQILNKKIVITIAKQETAVKLDCQNFIHFYD